MNDDRDMLAARFCETHTANQFSQFGQKKEPPLPAALRKNREASNRVDRSHSMSSKWTILIMNEKA